MSLGPRFQDLVDRSVIDNLRLINADKAAHVLDAYEVMSDQRRKAAAYGVRTPEGNKSSEAEDDGMIHVGDQTINYAQAPAQPQAPVPPKQGLLQKLAPALIAGVAGGALTATGIGAVVGIPLLLSALSQKPETPAQPTSPPPIVKEWDSNVEMTVEPPKGT